MRSHIDLLRNVIRSKKELVEKINKPCKEFKFFEELMKSPRSFGSTSGQGHTKKHSSIKEGETSKSGEIKNAKSKGKPACYHYGKLYIYYKYF